MIRNRNDPQVDPTGRYTCRGCDIHLHTSPDPARADQSADAHGWPLVPRVGLFFTTKGDDFAHLRRSLQAATSGPGCQLPKARVVPVERFAQPLGAWLLQDGLDAISLPVFAPYLHGLCAARTPPWTYADRELAVTGRACSWSCHDAAIAKATADTFDTEETTKGDG
jgi:hypothetical protein